MAKTNAKQQALLLDKDREKLWIQFFDSIENLSIRSSWYHSKWHQGNPWVMLCSHFSIKTSPSVMLFSYALNNDS